MPFSAARPTLLQPAPPFSKARRAAFFIQPALLSSEQPARRPKVNVFHLETRPAGPPISVIRFCLTMHNIDTRDDRIVVDFHSCF